MTAASQYDLKPAMKRPQTNLQTARRLITTHLGTKSRVSKEQTEMERENLRKARGKKYNILVYKFTTIFEQFQYSFN